MKIILYMAITANGMIARSDNSTPWSDEEWEEYKQIVKNSDAIIIGRKTYEVMSKGELERIGNPITFVLSSNTFENKDKIFFYKTIDEILLKIKEMNLSQVLINGGSKLNGELASNNLIDEIYLDVEPFVFGEGIPLFNPKNFEFNLELIDIKKYNNNGFQIRYKVIKD